MIFYSDFFGKSTFFAATFYVDAFQVWRKGYFLRPFKTIYIIYKILRSEASKINNS